MLFVTGGDAAFFNSLLVCLQGFAERLPGHHLLVCDFGFSRAQAEFLRSLGVWMGRPPGFASSGVFHCKAGMLSYLRHSGHDVDTDAAVIWLDADLTLMDVHAEDFHAVLADMTSAGAAIAACRAPPNRDIGQMLAVSADAAEMAPFVRIVAEVGVDRRLPYYSSGLFFCRSAAFFDQWRQLTHAVAHHPLFEQNMFNVVLHRDRAPLLALDCDEWQAQGLSLDQIRLVAPAEGGRSTAWIGGKSVKTLHATSPLPRHLLIGLCRMTVRDLDLAGTFKLFLPEPLRIHQLQLLASFIDRHGAELLRFGICTRAARTVEGFEFVTL